VIEGWVAATGADDDNVDDTMDELAAEIEAVMHADPYLDGTAGDSWLQSTELEVVQQGDRLMGLVVMSYAVTYHSLAPTAPAGLDDFLSVKATHDVAAGELAEDDQAHDEFIVQELPDES
jgi:hypothetical protein